MKTLNTNSGKFFYVVLACALLSVVACKKDNMVKEEEQDKFNIAEYIMVGETFWGNDVNNTPPYIMTFGDGKASWHTLDGDGETNYDVQDNKVVLADVGYIDIENGQVSNMLLVGVNFKQGKLIKRAEQPAFIGKTYPKGQYMIWKSTGEYYESASAKDYQITMEAEKVTETWMTISGPYSFPVSQENGYTSIFNVGGIGESDYPMIFYVDPETDKLVFWQGSAGTYYVHYKY